MYTHRNFKTKKELREAVSAWVDYQSNSGEWSELNPNKRPPSAVTYYQPGPFEGNEPNDGVFVVEGPHFPEAHKWYASCTAKDGKIVKVK